MGKTVRIKGQDVWVPLETGDIVTHARWAPGETRVVCGVYLTELPPQLDTGKPEFHAELDRRAIDPDDGWLNSPECGEVERDMARYWMVAGLTKIARAPKPELADRVSFQLSYQRPGDPPCFIRGHDKEYFERLADKYRGEGAEAFVTYLRAYFEKSKETS